MSKQQTVLTRNRSNSQRVATYGFGRDSLRGGRLRRLSYAVLEERRLLALGVLLTTLTNPNTALQQQGSQFGYTVAVGGPYTVVGTPYADLLGLSDTGLANVFNTSTGELVATLNNPPPATSDLFGNDVAVSAR